MPPENESNLLLVQFNKKKQNKTKQNKTKQKQTKQNKPSLFLNFLCKGNIFICND